MIVVLSDIGIIMMIEVVDLFVDDVSLEPVNQGVEVYVQPPARCILGSSCLNVP